MTIKNPVTVFDFEVALLEAGQLVELFDRVLIYDALSPLIERIRREATDDEQA